MNEREGRSSDPLNTRHGSDSEQVRERIEALKKEASKVVGEAVDKATDWAVKNTDDETGKKIGDAVDKAKDWAAKNPEKAATIATCVALAPVAAAVAVPAPKLFGFGSRGIAAGSVAARKQSRIGNVSSGSMFSTLQSAAAGGAVAAALVAGAAFVAAGASGTAVAAPFVHEAMKEGDRADNDGDKSGADNHDVIYCTRCKNWHVDDFLICYNYDRPRY
ncbi:hypothetical protein M011DRAFT_459800 [Sporormia fimetaria CBS 119925]|uniref:Uncharacterized protein n=1 Tax=Sporormia fimetaria CBS 119925 TaxID=1340428 RepID=A0A6A6V9S7_9PLEO|nr:hypothetical protein M011DRAFT_459800 [Sporormia fimetaria CBS 119925]